MGGVEVLEESMDDMHFLFASGISDSIQRVWWSQNENRNKRRRKMNEEESHTTDRTVFL